MGGKAKVEKMQQKHTNSLTSTLPLNAVQSLRSHELQTHAKVSNLIPRPRPPTYAQARTHLRPRPLPPNRQSHRVPLAPVRAHLAQPLEVVVQLPPQIVLQRHFRQRASQAAHLLVRQRADARVLVDVEARHQVRAGLGSEAVEGFERFGDELAFGEVGAVDEHLGINS